MKKGILTFFIALCLAFILPTALMAQENGEAAGADTSDLPNVGFIPFAYTGAVGEYFAKNALTEVARNMKDQQLFNPFDISDWLDSQFIVDRAGTVKEIIDRAKEVKLPVDYLCHGNVFKCGKSFGIIVTLYPVDSSVYTSYYYRNFINIDELDKNTGYIVEEMKNRAGRLKADEFKITKKVYVEKFTPDLLLFTKLPTGEESTSNVPILVVNQVDYRDTDHYFNQLLLYNLHTAGLFEITSNNIDKYCKEQPDVPTDADYVISANITISTRYTILTVSVINNKEGNITLSYKYPFKSLSLKEYSNVLKMNALVIASQILNENELKKAGIANIDANGNNPVFFQDYYVGMGNQDKVILPFGLNDITIGKNEYSLFVLPFTLSYLSDKKSELITKVVQ